MLQPISRDSRLANLLMLTFNQLPDHFTIPTVIPNSNCEKQSISSSTILKYDPVSNAGTSQGCGKLTTLVALVTGANRGIGFEIARQLGTKGIHVILGSRDLEGGESAAKKLASMKIKITPAQLDVTNQEHVEQLTQRIGSDFGRLDILVNNAGILIDRDKPASTIDLDLVRTTVETNLLGPWRLCKAFIPLMLKNRCGRIVNVSSGAGSFPGGLAKSSGYRSPAYSLSKTSLNALTLLLASELQGTNILVNAMCPGHTRTDMGGASAPRSVEEGADTAVWLATLPDDGPTGGVFRDRERTDW